MKATILILALLSLAGWIQAPLARADGTQASFRLVTGETNMPDEIAESIAMRLGVAFSEKLDNLILESDRKMIREHQKSMHPGQEPEIDRHFESVQVELRWSVTRISGKKRFAMSVEAIAVPSKKRLFKESVKLAVGKKKGRGLPEAAMNACPQIAAKVVDRLKRIPAPHHGRDGAVSPLPDRSPLRINPKVDCGHGKLRDLEILGHHYIEGINLVAKGADSGCQAVFEEVEDYVKAHQEEIEALRDKVRDQLLSIDTRKVLSCRHKIQDLAAKSVHKYRKRCKNQWSQVSRILGMVIHPEIPGGL
jgi:hypothetical protein